MDQQPYQQPTQPNPTQQQGYVPVNNGQQGYAPPLPNQPVNPKYAEYDTSPLSTGKCFLMILLMAIPIVNLIMPFVWAFGDQNVNKRSLGRALLIFFVISIILAILYFIFFAAMFSSVLNQMNGLF